MNTTNFRSQVSAAMLVLAAMSSCVSLYSVSDDSSKGIRFYEKVGLYRQSTTYNLTWLELTVNTSSDPAKPANTVFTVDETKWSVAIAQDVQDKVLAATSTSEIRPILAKLGVLMEAAEIEAALGNSNGSGLCKTMVSNVVEPVVRVDYSRPRYINVVAPYFSSASSTVKLAADGSLSEATASIDTTKLGDGLPIKGAIEKAIGVSVAETKSMGVVISWKPKGYSFTFVKEWAHSECPCNRELQPLTFDRNKWEFTRSELGSGKDSEPKPAITFSGAVKVPKPE